MKNTALADSMLHEYFQSETDDISNQCLNDIQSRQEWLEKRKNYKNQLFEMLGLHPQPEKTYLHPTRTGRVDHDRFYVEKLHFQSIPGLYVTANLYIPKVINQAAPTILYLCGHAHVKKNGISYGGKVAYQHHAAWFARHGYVCLIIDTLQLGEVEGIHHGTYHEKMWWWNSRGYTPAGVEAWNSIRALDYLETRKEVDANRFGVTGRSGGGMCSWWTAALDDRIKVAVPVAGITDMQNQVIDGCIEKHCDCMFMINTFRWDFPLIAALVAPRPLLISNSNKDPLFPLNGVMRLHEKVKSIYQLYKAEKYLGLHISEGPHKDTQEQQIHAFTWFNRFLKGHSTLIDKPATPFFEPQDLKVFENLPIDEINTHIHEVFVPRSPTDMNSISLEASSLRQQLLLKRIQEKSFGGWPTSKPAGSLNIKHVFSIKRQGLHLSVYDFTSQPHVQLRLYLLNNLKGEKSDQLVFYKQDDKQWIQWLGAMRIGFPDQFPSLSLPDPNDKAYHQICRHIQEKKATLAFMAPRGLGRTSWNPDVRKQTHIRR